MATKKRTKVDETTTPVQTGTKTTQDVDMPTTEPQEKTTIKYYVGIVTNCVRLNVRDAASLKGNVLCELPSGTKVKVHIDGDTEEWYKVRTENGTDGFCMKKYIAVQ